MSEDFTSARNEQHYFQTRGEFSLADTHKNLLPNKMVAWRHSLALACPPGLQTQILFFLSTQP